MPLVTADWPFMGNVFPGRTRHPSPPSCVPCFVRIGWSTPSLPSADLHMSCSIWPAILTELQSPSNHRILSVTDSHVTFRWKDYAHHSRQRTMSLTGEEFLRRFLQHVLPKGFPRIRYFGWLANRRRKHLLPLCRLLLAQMPPAAPLVPPHESALWLCPSCHGPMQVIERLTALQILDTVIRKVTIHDSS